MENTTDSAKNVQINNIVQAKGTMEDKPNKDLQLIFEGGEELQLTPIEAADCFAGRYLPNLDTQSISLPQEIVDYGTTTQAFNISTEERKEVASNMTGNSQEEPNIHLEKEKYKFDRIWEHLEGAKHEISVFKYVKESLRGVSAMFWSYQQSKTMVFFGSKDKIKNQEYDIILLLSQYRKFIIIEVKSHLEFQGKDLNSLKQGKIFFEYLNSYVEKETKQTCGNLVNDDKDTKWEYIPVLALPRKLRRDVKNPRHSQENHPKDRLDFVLITAEEFRSNFLDILIQDKIIDQNFCQEEVGDNYKTFVKMLYVSALSQKVNKSKSNIGMQLVDRTLLSKEKDFEVHVPSNELDESHAKLAGTDEDVISAGFPRKISSFENVKFSALKNKPVGSIESFIFWNPAQFQTINSEHNRLLIAGNFGTGKTLILMALAQKSCENNNKVIFVCDSTCSSRLFDKRIEEFCMERNIEFCSIDTSQKTEFETWLNGKHQSHLLIDELDFQSFHYVCAITKEFRKVTCIINPRYEMNAINSMCVPGEWKKISLSKVMRNTRHIYSAAVNQNFSSDAKLGKTFDGITSTVLGPIPKLILINKDDLYLGLTVALRMMKEEKFVVLRENMISFEMIAAVLSSAIPDIPAFEDPGGFELAKKGCLVVKPFGFSGMESRSIIIAGEAMQTSQDTILRCTTNLIHVTPVTQTTVHPQHWAVIVPYQEESEKFQQLIKTLDDAHEHFYVIPNRKEYTDNFLRNKLWLDYKQYNDEEANKLRKTAKLFWGRTH